MTTSARNARYETDDGRAVLTFEFLGRRAQVYGHQRRGAGWVYLGPDLEDAVAVEVPAAPDDGRPEPLVVRGATDDPEIVGLAARFFEVVDRGAFKPGEAVSAGEEG